MTTEILMPKVDMVMENGTFVEWLKGEGQVVAKGEPLFVIQTDKAAIEVEAPASGVLVGLRARPDEVIPVTAVIGYITAPGERPPSAPSAAPSAVAPRPEKTLLRATPLARSLAREQGLDLRQVPGSGTQGRIYKADVERYRQGRPAEAEAAALPQAVPPLYGRTAYAPATLPPAPARAPQEAAPDGRVLPQGKRVLRREPLSGPRAIIAERMALSARTIPSIHLSIEADMREMARLRAQVNPMLEQRLGLKASYTALIARAVAYLLPQHPYLNSSLVDGEIVLWEDVHLGIAMQLQDTLVVPVILQAQELRLEGLVREMARLVDLAQKKKLPPAEMTGGTFTISNLGMYGITAFTALVNPPEAAILAVGVIRQIPADREARQLVATLTVTADHRINDGVRVARFLSDLQTVLETPYLLV